MKKSRRESAASEKVWETQSQREKGEKEIKTTQHTHIMIIFNNVLINVLHVQLQVLPILNTMTLALPSIHNHWDHWPCLKCRFRVFQGWGQPGEVRQPASSGGGHASGRPCPTRKWDRATEKTSKLSNTWWNYTSRTQSKLRTLHNGMNTHYIDNICLKKRNLQT